MFSSVSFQSNNLGTAAICYETTANLNGLVCGNFASGRTFKFNNQTGNCSANPSLSSIPKVNGGYCFQMSAGGCNYASFNSW